MAATADVIVSLNPSAAFRSFDEYAKLQQIRGKAAEQTLRKLMKFWISFALFRIPEAVPADIERNLMTITAAYSKFQTRTKRRRTSASVGRFGKLADKYRGTVAAAVVAALNYKGARNATSMKGRKLVVGDGAAFYGKVGQFINARKYSAKHHRAGFYPAISALKIGKTGRMPRYARTPGSYKESIEAMAAELVAENFASSSDKPGAPAKGIAGLAPNCLADAEKDVAALLTKWLTADLMDAAHGAGFSKLAMAA